MKKILNLIHSYSSSFSAKSIDELQSLAEKFKKEPHLELNVTRKAYWFSLVQEIAFQTLGLRAFDTQLLAGLWLTEGKIIEMKTGEGKTLVSIFPASYFALEKKGVHVVTVNEYLAERDQKWMRKVYNSLGISSSLVKGNLSLEEKKLAYFSDITYVTNSEVVFDYLRDTSAKTYQEIVQRPFSFCLIDEIDSVLIDEARTPLILSEPEILESRTKLYLAKRLANSLQKQRDFEIDEKRKDIFLTEFGYREIKKRLGKKTLYDPQDAWILEILNALKALYLFQRNRDYIVLNGKIVIVDEFTGRVMEDRRWSLGLHEAIEVKENLEIGKKTKTKTSITYQNFFPLYPLLSGMTGTAKTTEQEFLDIYNLKVVVIPPNKPLLRKDLPDLVYSNEVQKWKAVLNQANSCYKEGQPILIGTSSIEKSEFLSDLFSFSKIPHQVLNAKPENVRRESEIIAQAGKHFAVTIATNMAGRGTDIILGGNPFFQVKDVLRSFLIEEKALEESLSLLSTQIKQTLLENRDSYIIFKKEVLREYNQNEETKNLLQQEIESLPYGIEECKPTLQKFYQALSNIILEDWKLENKSVKELGGLFVLGTERHETRRIDNQLRGRAGRQGDPGISRFFVSLDDNLLKLFGGDNLRNWIQSILKDDESPLEASFLTKSIENAQKKLEEYNYDLRKNIFQYDTILNTQRKQFLEMRKEFLASQTIDELLLRWSESLYDENKRLKDASVFYQDPTEESYKNLWIQQDLRKAQSNLYENNLLAHTRYSEQLLVIDNSWTEHLEGMDYIKETISWRSYGQQNPLIEYQEEALISFQSLFEKIRFSMVYSFVNQAI